MAVVKSDLKLILKKQEKKIFIKAIIAAYQAGRADGNFIHNFTPQLMQGQTACTKKILADFVSVDE